MWEAARRLIVVAQTFGCPGERTRRGFRVRLPAREAEGASLLVGLPALEKGRGAGVGVLACLGGRRWRGWWAACSLP